MSKFSLLTTLTLNAAGYNKGINQAKKSTQALKKGTQDATKSITKSFGSLTPAISGVNGQLGGLGQAISGGVGAFRSMIPAIKTVKTAMIASGIGAIVIAISASFAALSSYISGTKNGADSLNKILTIARGAFNALLVRVQLLGEAVALVFQGKFKQAGETLKEAFKGGLLDEIKKNVEEAGDLAERENNLKKDQIKFIRQESELRHEIARLIEISSDKTKTQSEREAATNQAIKLQNQLSSEKVRLKQEEYDILTQINAQGNNSYDDDRAEAELYAQINDLKKEELDKVRELKNRKEEILGITGKQIAKQEALNGVVDDYLEKYAQPKKLQNIEGDWSFADSLAMPEELEEDDPFLNIVSERVLAMENFKNVMTETYEAIGQIGEGFTESWSRSMGAMGNTLAQGASSFKEYGKNVKNTIKDIIGSLLAEAVATMIVTALKTAKNLGPLGLAVAPVLAGLGAGIAKTAFNSLPAFATGGIVGGASFTGDKVIARLNSGEGVLTRDGVKNAASLYNGGYGQQTLIAKFEGDDMVFYLNKMNRKNSIT